MLLFVFGVWVLLLLGCFAWVYLLECCFVIVCCGLLLCVYLFKWLVLFVCIGVGLVSVWCLFLVC